MGAIGFYEYGAMVSSDESVAAIFDMMPRIALVMFGAGTLPLDTPQGYFACMFLWLALIAFTHAILLGATIISKEEKEKTAEFLFTKPINRKTIITGKIITAVVNVIVIAFVGWIVTILTFLPQVEEVDLFIEVNLTMLGMLITQIIFLFIGLCISAICKGHKNATKFAAIAVIISYFISVITEMIGDVDFLNILSPIRYFNVASVIAKGLNPLSILISALLILVTGYLSYTFWDKKDLNS